MGSAETLRVVVPVGQSPALFGQAMLFLGLLGLPVRAATWISSWRVCRSSQLIQAAMPPKKPHTMRTTSAIRADTAGRRRVQVGAALQRETGRPRIGLLSRNRWRSSRNAAADA